LRTCGAQLYAEPSVILYIRQHFGLDDVVIVSPDAGGAKRCGPRWHCAMCAN
jgi:phosphoribosylpyrophosphate synthetase